MLSILFVPAESFAGVKCPEDPRYRFAPCTAYPDEQQKIMDEISKGMEAYEQFEEAALKQGELRALWQTRRLTPEEADAWEKSKNRMSEQKSLMELKLNYAIALTDWYYGLGLKNRKGEIQNGPMEMMGAAWKPKFLYAEKDEQGNYKPVFRKVDRPGRKPYYIGDQFQRTDGAITSPDGQIYVSPQIFRSILDSKTPPEQRSPRLLAMALHHEAVHFDQLVTTGWSTHEEIELEAWKATISAANAYDAPAGEIKDMESFRDHLSDKIDSANAGRIDRKKLGSPFAWVDGQEEARSGWENAQSEVERMQKEADKIAVTVKADRAARELEAKRKLEEELREMMRNPRRPPPPNSEAVTIPAPNDRGSAGKPPNEGELIDIDPRKWEQFTEDARGIIDMFKVFCRNPRASQKFRGVIGDINYYMKIYRLFREKLGEMPGLGSGAGEERCVRGLIGEIPSYPAAERIVDVDYFRTKARDYSPPPAFQPPGRESPDSSERPPSRPNCRYQGDWCR